MRVLFAAVLLAGAAAGTDRPTASADVIVYGGHAAAITAAIQIRAMGLSVAIVAPERHLGGMSVEGLGGSDINNHWFRNDVAIGGLAAEFYRRVGARYGARHPVYLFEPHVAEAVFEEMLSEHRIPVHRGQRLREPLPGAVEWRAGAKRLRAIRTESGALFEGRYFVDATIEGDLLAAAGVETVVGREPNAKYGETKNGIRGENAYRQFPFRLDPYWEPGNPASGLLPTIRDEPFGTPGEGDQRIQGYCFRLCLTREPANRIPIAKPANYDPKLYEIYRRYANLGGKLFHPEARLPRGKTDLGSWHDLSANLYGMNYDYPSGSYAVRDRIYREHRDFTHGLLWFLANDPALPAETRARWQGWGLPKDEFTDNGGWPRQLYVRDARRMVSDLVLTERHTRRVNPEPAADPVAVAYWPPDTHHVRRIVRDGAVYNEGFVFGGTDWGPFGVPNRALVPREREAENLLTPTVPSSSHVAYGAIRLEWTFMALGQSAGAAAALAARENIPVQRVPYARLREALLEAGQVLSLQLAEPKPGAERPSN